MEFKLLTKSEFIENIDGFIELYNKCFTGGITYEEIYWRYLENPIADLCVYVAIDNGKIIANYAISPMDIEKEGQIFKAGLSINTMTDPEYQGKGLFVKLANGLYEELKKKGYDLVLGFPHVSSNRAFIEKLGWINLNEIPMLEVDLKKLNFLKRKSSYGDNKEHILIKNRIKISKNKEYFDWRYERNPKFKYHKIESGYGYIFLKEHNELINIIDYKAESMVELENLLNEAILFGLEKNKDKLTAWATLNSKEHLLLQKYGFINKMPIIYFGIKGLKEKLDVEFYDFKNWDIRIGDNNIF